VGRCSAPTSWDDLQEVEREIGHINSAISDIRGSPYRLDKQLGHDLGQDHMWCPLSKKVFERSKDGNDYQLTIFGHLMHRQTGAAWYRLCYGTFAGFNETKRTMLYEGGQMCWEGPPHRRKIYLYCGPTHKFLDLEEIYCCIFRRHFETPLVCSEEYRAWVKGMSDIDLSDFVAQWEMVE
jgi:protein kinase C substrate 80K-H